MLNSVPGIAGSGLGLMGVLAYLRWVLPRLPSAAAALPGVALALLGIVASIRLTPWCWIPTGALALGHIGHGLQRRRRRVTAAIANHSPPATPSTRSATAASPTRKTLGRYRIDRELGRGSMGTVYLGHDPQAGRQVAIKTMALNREFAGPELVDARDRFFREADHASRLRHPDIVAVFDAGEAQGLAFIVMEYAPGSDLLAHTLPDKLLPVATVLSLLERVAIALAHAHRQGVVHRDIKPANVMFDAVSGSLKVTDFGIARVADACRTRTGLVFGTPSFMSPEQMAGGRVDGRTDLYALGVMLFQLLTGELPHRADSMSRLLHQIAHEPAPDVRSLRPELPETLAKLIALALEKRPEDRHRDAQQMADDLRAVARRLPPEPRTPDAGHGAS